MGPKPASSSQSSLSTGPSNGARRVKGKRTRTGCLTCRARKVKCDEQPGTCANCERVCLACRWPVVRNVLDDRTPQATSSSTPVPGQSPQLAPSSGPIRRNRPGACNGCRAARAVCSQDQPACTRCLENGIICDYSQHSGPRVTPSSIGGSPADADEAWRNPGKFVHGLPRRMVDSHMEAFFAHVYHVQGNAIVHRGTLLRDIADGSISRQVLLAICAVASRFVEPPSNPGMPPPPNPITGNADAQRWSAEVKATILTDAMSQDSITAALLIAKHDINSGRFAQAFVLSALATRMAVGLAMYKELDADDPATRIERETRRRLMYACYSLDRLMSTGIPENMCVPAASIKLQLPCNEQQYSFGTGADTPIPILEADVPEELPAHLYKNVGMFGLHVRLIGIRAMILQVARHRRPDEKFPWDPTSRFAVAERRINAWHAALAPQLQLEPETIYTCQYQNELTPLTMLHVWYHMNMAELTRIAMPGFVESLDADIIGQAPPGWVEQMRELCVTHARLMARTLRHVANVVNVDSIVIGDPSLPICVYEGARVRLQYAFLLPNEMQAAELSELVSDVAVMSSFLDRQARYYVHANILLKEMRKMLRRHGLDPREAMSEPSLPGSPEAQDPWSRHVRSIRDAVPRRPQPPVPSHTYPPPHQGMPLDQHYPDSRGSLPLQNHVDHVQHAQHAQHAQHPHAHAQQQHNHHSQHPQHAHNPNNHAHTPNHTQNHNQGPHTLPSMPLYAEPQTMQSWDGSQPTPQDDISALLGEVGTSQGVGMPNGNIFDSFANWVASGYDGGGMPLNGVV